MRSGAPPLVTVACAGEVPLPGISLVTESTREPGVGGGARSSSPSRCPRAGRRPRARPGPGAAPGGVCLRGPGRTHARARCSLSPQP